VEVVVDEVLRQQHGIVAAAQKHVVVAVDQIEVVAQMFVIFFTVNAERYLHKYKYARPCPPSDSSVCVCVCVTLSLSLSLSLSSTSVRIPPSQQIGVENFPRGFPAVKRRKTRG